METLDKLEACIDNLLRNYDTIKREKEQLQAQLANLEQEKSALEAQNQALLDALAARDEMREIALRRIDSFVCKIEEYNNLG